MNEKSEDSQFREIDPEEDKPEATEAPQPDAAQPSWPLKIKLQKAVMAHGDTLNEIELREPSAADVERTGFPCSLDFTEITPQPKIDARAMSAMISLLAGIPPSSVRALHPTDFATIAWSIAPLFLPRATG